MKALGVIKGRSSGRLSVSKAEKSVENDVIAQLFAQCSSDIRLDGSNDHRLSYPPSLKGQHRDGSSILEVITGGIWHPLNKCRGKDCFSSVDLKRIQ